MKQNKLTMLTIGAIALALPLASQAKEPKASPSPAAAASPAAKKGAQGAPFRGKISAVDAGAKTFTIQGKPQPRIYKITDESKLEKGGAPATMNDVKVDDLVRGSCVKTGDGAFDVKSAKLGPKTAEELAADEAAKAKKAAKAAAKPTP